MMFNGRFVHCTAEELIERNWTPEDNKFTVSKTKPPLNETEEEGKARRKREFEKLIWPQLFVGVENEAE